MPRIPHRSHQLNAKVVVSDEHLTPGDKSTIDVSPPHRSPRQSVQRPRNPFAFHFRSLRTSSRCILVWPSSMPTSSSHLPSQVDWKQLPSGVAGEANCSNSNGLGSGFQAVRLPGPSSSTDLRAHARPAQVKTRRPGRGVLHLRAWRLTGGADAAAAWPYLAVS